MTDPPAEPLRALRREIRARRTVELVIGGQPPPDPIVRVMSGDPDPALISSSFVERNNLTMRMSMRRFTRLTC